LWNAIDEMIGRMGSSMGTLLAIQSGRDGPAATLFERLWLDFFGAAGDLFPEDPHRWLRQWFYAAEWNRAYDLIEFIASHVRGPFADDCNAALKRERAAYQIVQGKVVELTDEGQLKAIDEAMVAGEPFAPVREHLRTALARLADRPEPDARNAAREAISAVESLVGMIAGSPGATLDDGLKLLQSRKIIPLRPSLNRAWGAIYGYASDAGIRHGLKEGQAGPDLDDATYVVVSCSAVVSYLIALANKAGVKVG
jgi:hypothetical protein